MLFRSKVHKLRVSTTRKGARILAPESYVAAPPDEIVQGNVDLVASRPFDTPDIGLRASFETAGKGTRLQIQADPRDFLLERAGNTYTGALSVMFVYYNADGSRSASMPVTSKVSLTQEQLDAAMKTGYLFHADAAPPIGTRSMRLIVEDAGTGTVGSLSVPMGAAAPKP